MFHPEGTSNVRIGIRNAVQLKDACHLQIRKQEPKFITRERTYWALQIIKTTVADHTQPTASVTCVRCSITEDLLSCMSSAAGKQQLLRSPCHFRQILQRLNCFFLQWENLLHAFWQKRRSN